MIGEPTAEAIKKKVREVVLELCQRAPGGDNSDGGSSSGDEDTPKKAVRCVRITRWKTVTLCR